MAKSPGSSTPQPMVGNSYSGTTGADHFQRQINAMSSKSVSTKLPSQPSTTGPGNANIALNAYAQQSVTGNLPYNGTGTKDDFRMAMNDMVKANGTVAPTPKVPYFKTSSSF